MVVHCTRQSVKITLHEGVKVEGGDKGIKKLSRKSVLISIISLIEIVLLLFREKGKRKKNKESVKENGNTRVW